MADTAIVEDPLSFFASIREECPDIISILTTEQVKLLSQCPRDPYSKGKVDKEYLSDAWNYLQVRARWKESSFSLKRFLVEPKGAAKAFNAQDLEIFEKKKSTFEKVLSVKLRM